MNREDKDLRPLRGRGAVTNPGNRFETRRLERDQDVVQDWAQSERPETEYFRDASKTILTKNDSPDLPFDVSLNPYRGCEHGCAYCYARPSHEFLGYSAGLDFETKILVKEQAPELLEKELGKKSWRPQVVALSGVTDPYQPIERQLELTRKCLEIFAQCRNPVMMITKNKLITRDLDHLKSLARFRAVQVMISLTTLDPDLSAKLEPRTSIPQARLEAIRALAEAGIPVGAFLAPMIPGLTDQEVPQLMEAARRAGARYAAWLPLRLPRSVADQFSAWLQVHFPDRAKKILSRVRSTRDGALNESDFFKRFRPQGEFGRQMKALFDLSKKRLGFDDRFPPLNSEDFRPPAGPQGSLFE